MKKLLLALFMMASIAAVAQPKVNGRMSYYTHEKEAEIIVYIPADVVFKAADATIDGKKTALKSGLNLIKIDATKLTQGTNNIPVALSIDGKAQAMSAKVVKLPKTKGNEVKIDYVTGGLWVNGLPMIPYGYYCSNNPRLIDDMTEEIARGFNLVSPYQGITDDEVASRLAYMDHAAAMGQKVNYNICSLAGSQGIGIADNSSADEKLEKLRKEINMVKDHPALLSYYIADEPDGQDVPAELLERSYNIIKELDPYHPISIVIVSAAPARTYAGTHDIIMTDPYVVPNTHAKNAALTVKSIKEEMCYEKAVWLVPQTFGGGEWWTRDPTPQEMRMICYASAVYGGAGYQAFILRPKSLVMWSEYAKVGMELQELTPYLLSGETSDVITGDNDVIAKAFHRGDRAMVVVVNRENTPKNIMAATKFNGITAKVSLPFEHRDTTMLNGVITDMIEPFGVRVYKIETACCKSQFAAKENESNLIINPSFEYIPTVGVPSATYSSLGKNAGSNYFIDSRVAYDGEHSLRIINSTNNDGPSSQFYPIPLDFDRFYTISVWAKADPQSLEAGPVKFKMSIRTFFTSTRGQFGEGEFELTDEWKRYEITARLDGESSKHGGLSNVAIQLIGKGTAWFDLVEALPDLSTSMEYTADGKGIVVTISNNAGSGDVRYTLDGSTPTEKSQLYTTPLTLNKVCNLKAQIFRNGEGGGVMEALIPAHKGLNAKVIYNTPADDTPLGGDKALVDGYTGKVVFNHPRWQRWYNKDMDVTIDLGEVTDINKLTAWFFHSSGDHVVPPTAVEYLISNDGKNFQSVGTITLGEAKNLNAGKDKYPVTKDKIGKKARYVRIVAKSHGQMPAWFLAAGNAWTYCDEFIVE